MVLNAPFPSDIRVSKEAGSLIKAGHEVHLICTAKKGQQLSEIHEEINVSRIRGLASFVQVGLWDIVNSLNFIHPLFYIQLKKFIIDNNIEVLHIHDLPLAKTAILLGKQYNIPVIVDFHENYPEALKVWFEWKKNPFIRLKNRLFFAYKRWLMYEKYVTINANHIIAVVEEMKSRLISAHGIDPSKISVITNSEYKNYKEGPVFKDVYKHLKDSFIIAYTGNVGPHRGVDTVIESMQYLKDLPVKFALVGTINNAVKSKLNSIILKHDLQDQVFIYGYQPFTKFLSYMSMADVNIIPHHSNQHTDNTIPHKIYQGMQVGKPLIVSSSAPIKRIVEETNAGLVFEAGNPIDLAEKIRILYANSELRNELATNGIHATQNNLYNWESTEKLLQSLYASFDNRNT